MYTYFCSTLFIMILIFLIQNKSIIILYNYPYIAIGTINNFIHSCFHSVIIPISDTVTCI